LPVEDLNTIDNNAAAALRLFYEDVIARERMLRVTGLEGIIPWWSGKFEGFGVAVFVCAKGEKQAVVVLLAVAIAHKYFYVAYRYDAFSGAKLDFKET